MITFTDYMKGSKTDCIARAAFTEMVRHGYDPVAFLDWYAEEGQYLTEADAVASTVAAPMSWLGTILGAIPRAASGVVQGAVGMAGNIGHGMDKALGRSGIQNSATSPTGWYHVGANVPVPVDANKVPIPQPHLDPPGQKLVQNAMNHMQSLISRQWIAKDDPQLQSTLQGVAEFLKQKSKAADHYGHQGAQDSQKVGFKGRMVGHEAPKIPVGTDPMAAKMGSSTTAPVTSWHIMQGDRLIEQFVLTCARKNVNPWSFIEWYKEEGYYLNERVLFEGRFGDWLGATWSGISNWWGGGNFGDGYNKKYDEIKTKSLWDAANALKELQKGLPNFGGQEFAQQLKLAIDSMNKMLPDDKKIAGDPAPEDPMAKLKGETPKDDPMAALTGKKPAATTDPAAPPEDPQDIKDIKSNPHRKDLAKKLLTGVNAALVGIPQTVQPDGSKKPTDDERWKQALPMAADNLKKTYGGDPSEIDDILRVITNYGKPGMTFDWYRTYGLLLREAYG
jgi:hypothetical protein